MAVATEDGVHVSAHFGRAPYFLVLTIENGTVTGEERRVKSFHEADHSGAHQEHGGTDSHAAGMASVVTDCSIVVAGGMRNPAYEAIEASGLEPILTNLKEISQVGHAFATGTLVNLLDRIHHR